VSFICIDTRVGPALTTVEVPHVPVAGWLLVSPSYVAHHQYVPAEEAGKGFAWL
jgi:hypothetical protein